MRETQEESGVALDAGSVKYFASQPWPFPSSLMLGFTAVCTEGGDGGLEGEGGGEGGDGEAGRESLPAVPFDEKEMDHVAWFSRAQCRRALPHFLENDKGAVPELHFPGGSSMGRMMLQAWAGEEQG